MTIGKIPNQHIPGLPSAPGTEAKTAAPAKPAIPVAERTYSRAPAPPAPRSELSNLRNFFLGCMDCFPVEVITGAAERRRNRYELARNLTAYAVPACPPPLIHLHYDDLDFDELMLVRHYVKSAYDDLRFSHGTNQSGLEVIQRNGMSTHLKRKGAAISSCGDEYASNSELGHQARQHNFVTKNKEMATMYANLSSINARDSSRKSGADAIPKVVRLFQTSDFPEIERDPDSQAWHLAYRTTGDIPRHAVRQGKDSARYSEEILTTLRKYIAHQFNVSLSTGDIAKGLLDGIESDSDDDDFSLAPIIKML